MTTASSTPSSASAMPVTPSSPSSPMKAHPFLAVCCGVIFAAAQEQPPLANPQAADPAIAEIDDFLEKLGPRSNGMSTGVNQDDEASLTLFMEDVSDLSALRGAPAKNIDIFGSMDLLATGKAVDLTPLAGLPVESLWIWKVPFTDLSPLKSTRLKKLLIMGAEVTDISPLKDLPLTSLTLWCTNVTDLSPLKGMRLTYLKVDPNEHVRVEDITPLEGMKLESLVFHANGVSKGIDILRQMESLATINQSPAVEFWKQYDSGAALRERVAKAGLKFTRLGGDADGKISLCFHGDDIVDLTPLGDLPVVSLRFMKSRIADLRPLAGTPLRVLFIDSDALTDLSPLRETLVTRLHLNAPNLTSLTSLEGTKLEVLSIKCPKLTDLSPLRDLPLHDLDIRGSGVTDLGPLKGMPLESFRFDPDRITRGLDVLKGIKTLKLINGDKLNEFNQQQDGEEPPEGDLDPFAEPTAE